MRRQRSNSVKDAPNGKSGLNLTWQLNFLYSEH